MIIKTGFTLRTRNEYLALTSFIQPRVRVLHVRYNIHARRYRHYERRKRMSEGWKKKRSKYMCRERVV